jgi:hypothetical protein
MFEPEQKSSNADANFESTKIKKKLDFSQVLSLQRDFPNNVFEGKVVEQNETSQPIEKSSRKF